jgi:beta-lactamase regulating signal transducer with metallopeptidase domain/flagellar biosynthesis chaperone FliJ
MVSTLARASIDGAMLVAAVWILSRLLRLSPATRTMLWWCAAAKFVVALAWTTPIAIPVLPAETPVVQRLAEVARSTVEVDAGGVATPAQLPVTRALVSTFREWSSWAAIGWTFGLLVVAAAGVRRWRETARMLRVSQPAAGEVHAHVIDLASRLRLRRVPEVRTSNAVETPLVTGLVRPVVLLPSDRFRVLTARQQQLALCHELAHLKRADLWLGCVPALAERLFFFHPLVHLASREYALSRELACDAAVMETLDAAPQEYGRLLLALGVAHPQPGLTAAGAAWSFLNLKRRIAMLQDVSTRSNRSRVVAAAAVGLALAAMVPMQLAARPSARPSAPKTGLAPIDMERLAEPQLHEPAALEPAELLEPEPQAGSRAPKNAELNFVLLLEDDQQTMSGSAEDVARAKRHQRNGEPLLWFRLDGREYVIRDPELVRQARALWTRVYESGVGLDAVGDLMNHTLRVDELAEFSKLAEIGDLTQSLRVDELTEFSKLAAEQGALGAQLGSMASEQALRALTDARAAMPEISASELERQRRSLQDTRHVMQQSKQELEERMRQLEQRLKHDVEGQLHELQQRMRALEGPMREMVAPMQEFKHRMEAFGQTVESATRKANEETRALIERAIASGLAQTVR